MSLVTLSPFEQAYILSGIEAGVRADGRDRTQYRHFTIETGILPNANGSARLQLVCDRASKDQAMRASATGALGRC